MLLAPRYEDASIYSGGGGGVDICSYLTSANSCGSWLRPRERPPQLPVREPQSKRLGKLSWLFVERNAQIQSVPHVPATETNRLMLFVVTSIRNTQMRRVGGRLQSVLMSQHALLVVTRTLYRIVVMLVLCDGCA
jgi:hypothetical protein